MYQMVWVVIIIAGLVPASLSADDVDACLETDMIKCESDFRDSISEAYDQKSYNKMCTATMELKNCADIDCGGEPWDPLDDYLTYFLQFMKDTNLCEDFTGQAMEKESRLAKDCLDNLAEDMKTVPDACVYYGGFAECIVTRRFNVRGEIIDKFREIMKDQLKRNMPTKFGDIVIDTCPDWNTHYDSILM